MKGIKIKGQRKRWGEEKHRERVSVRDIGELNKFAYLNV